MIRAVSGIEMAKHRALLVYGHTIDVCVCNISGGVLEVGVEDHYRAMPRLELEPGFVEDKVYDAVPG